MADNSKTLDKGEARIPAKDDTATSVTVSATDGVVTSESRAMRRASGACPQQNYGQTDPPQGTATKDHRRFFEDRVNVDSPGHLITYEGNPQAGSFTDYLDASLDILVGGDLIVSVNTLDLVDADPITSWSNIDLVASLSLAQSTSASAPTYRTLTEFNVARFDGTNDWMNVTNSDFISVIKPTGSWTVGMHLQMNDVVAVQTMLAQYIEAAGNGRIAFRYNSGMEIYLGGDGTLGTTQVTGSALTSGQLYQVFFIRDGDTFTIYVDGKQDATHTDTGTRNLLGSGSVVGARSTSSTDYKGSLTEYFDGDLLDLEIQQRAFNSIDIAEKYRAFGSTHKDELLWFPKDDDRVVAWFDATHYTREGSVSNWLDLTGNVAMGQTSTSTTYNPTHQADAINGHPAIYFDGSSDHLLIDGISNAVAGSTGFTMSMLVAPDFSKNDTSLVSFNTSSGGNVYIIGTTTSGNLQVYDGSWNVGSTVYTTGDVLLLTWMLDPDTGDLRLLVDGQEEIVINTSLRPEAGGKFSIGQEWDGGSISGYYKGHMGALVVGKGYSEELRALFEAAITYSYYDVDDIPDLALWLRAKRPGTAYADLDPVTSWADLSTNAFDATQGTASLQPTYDAIDFDENPSIDFDGSDQLEIASALANASTDQFSAILMARNASAAAGTLLTTSNVSGEGWTLGYDVNGDLVYEHEGQGSVTSNHDTTANHIVSLRRNGLDVELGNNADLDATGTLTGYTASSGASTYVGGSGTETGFNGSKFEIACYNRSLKNRELYSVARHVQSRHVISQSKPTIPNVNFEFDAQDLVGYTAAQEVPAMTDVSGTADATQGTVVNQARYYPHVLGAHPALYFDGTDDFYVTPTVPATGADPRMMAYVVGPRKSGTNWRTISSWGTSSTSERFGVMSFKSSDYSYAFNGYGNDHAITVPSGKPEILIVGYDGTDVVAWVDGVEVWRESLALNTGSTYSLCFGATNEGASLHYDGFLGWAMAAAHFPTNQQVQDLTLWLARKFDVIL